MAEEDRKSAEIFVTKLAAAQRLVDAAIRIYFDDEDELAVTCIASAAHGMLKDLLVAKGNHPFGVQFRDGVTAIALSFVRGQLTQNELDLYRSSSSLWELVEKAAQHIREFGQDRPFSELVTLFHVEVPPATAKVLNDEWNLPANFLKHAEHDADGLLSMDSVKNEDLLTRAANVYLELTSKATPEMEVLIAYLNTNHDLSPFGNRLDEYVAAIGRYSTEHRKGFCSQLIRTLKKLEPEGVLE